MNKRLKSLVIVLALILIAYPFKSTVIPAWRLRVVNEKGEPYIGKKVRQAWKHYSLELDTAENMEDRWTDHNGYVAFPERTIRANLLWRTIVPLWSTVMMLAHGSTGISADVAASGPQGYESVKYVPNKPLPEQLVLPSENKDKED